MRFIDKLAEKILVFDGAMGTMLQAAGLRAGECPELINLKNPETVKNIHRQYVKAGADIVETNTFGGSRLKLLEYGLADKVAEINASAVRLAKESADGQALVALSVGPTGKLMFPNGPLTFDEAHHVFSEQISAGAAAGADMICIETMSDLGEIRAALLAAKDAAPGVPVICSMTFEPNKRTLMGTDPVAAVITLQALGADIIGANCSGGPGELLEVIEEMARYARVPLIVQPNAGMPMLEGDRTVFPLSAAEMGEYVPKLAAAGASLIGGCCGTSPEYIRVIKERSTGLKPLPRNITPVTAITSARQTLFIGSGHPVRIVGERINPTGRKELSEQLRKGDMSLILREAVEQVERGANLLDVNMGLPEIDEAALMEKAVNSLQKVISVPLQLDSTDPKVLEAGLKAYHGKAIINSVNGKEESLKTILPLAKRYGACILGLALDDKGIPKTSEGRLAAAEKIMQRALALGIPKEDIIIDSLVLTASAQQDTALACVECTRLVKEELGLSALLGVTNISYGLPNRSLIDNTFLAMCLAGGVDVVIFNVENQDMVNTVRASEVLTARDKHSRNYINLFAAGEAQGAVLEEQAVEEDRKPADCLYRDIINGFKENTVPLLEEVLKQGMMPLQIVDDLLVPALDEVGGKYDRGEFFLPQLMQSAEVVQAAFARLKQELKVAGDSGKGTVLLATVKGDIHDIGKNIVKVLLENYGYEVVDMGKDVPPEEIVRAAKEKDIRLIGLSALMTTTVVFMKETIDLLRQEKPDCKVVVGGAVLNEKYAENIRADFYARDAREGVAVAREVFGR
ncbi:homocysteine S-methyltransferase [Desulfofarcimen acetoxidans DSM 771]|uniref:Methionine synthase n=1 Tax=Desulfofarcimen acetoxidans (strain ATCC 49208 / DSM 771 / KCTC 5769 / VKM B-1644 / 5575) TaxID=485916 RepID=C8W2L3_DESAS|nr:homocysteine S-methyltransferase family protein [Desulfofarcimen acetoxidans]ACV63697.1 homocysteine S-methyltransferase [Desulfofarcimen acetoxidans DSM 771]